MLSTSPAPSSRGIAISLHHQLIMEIDMQVDMQLFSAGCIALGFVVLGIAVLFNVFKG